MKKRILLIRTHESLAGGGPVPPLGLLYIASVIMNTFGEKYELKILHTGLKDISIEEVKRNIEHFAPHIVGLSNLTCEANLMHKIAKLTKEINKDIVILVGGPHASLVKGDLLQDKNIDYSIIGEGEVTICEFLEVLENDGDPSGIDGIVYRIGEEIVATPPRAYIENLDNITISAYAWDLIDIREYGKYANWNGTCKEKFYMPILTSRGCPFYCAFCRSRDTFGNKFRARSPENVFLEIKLLHERYNVKEIHFFDDVFNFDIDRAKRICSLIIKSGIKFSLAFPNGLRADIMSDDLLTKLTEAGTYKINYGIETVIPRLQGMVKKNLNIERVKDTVNKTVKKGIITAGYFMLGFPTETCKEMMQTIEFAVKSNLDNAFFFKFTDFLNAQSYQLTAAKRDSANRFDDLHFYSLERSSADVSPVELNDLILEAQQRFYLNLKRICRGILRAPNKLIYLKNLSSAFALILQAYLIKKLTKT